MPFLGPTLHILDRLAVRLGRVPQKAPHLVSGARGEELAYLHLRKLGLVVVARDYRSARRRGDIDLIAWERATLCFVEVKTRSRRNFMLAETAVDDEKKATVSALAREYMRQLAHAESKTPPYRFDVISVYLESNGSADITLLRNAFEMS